MLEMSILDEEWYKLIVAHPDYFGNNNCETCLKWVEKFAVTDLRSYHPVKFLLVPMCSMYLRIGTLNPLLIKIEVGIFANAGTIIIGKTNRQCTVYRNGKQFCRLVFLNL